MNREVVMICLESLGIGGVETCVINQIKAIIRKNMEVIVLAKFGIYVDKVVGLGAKYIEWSFDIENRVNLNKIMELCEILKDNKVTKVIINQFPCINNVIFACLLNKVPYFAYIHCTYKAFENENVNSNVYEYFSVQFPIYKDLLPLFFNMAEKIITITEISKKYIIDKYNIEESKIIYIPNSIDFSDFHSNKRINGITNFLFMSRLSDEKLFSIKQALDFFKHLYLCNKDTEYSLIIIGDGNKKNEIIRYIEELDLTDKVKMVGAVANVRDYIENCDCVIGMDRCILEAIAMNRIAIISGYDGLKGIVNMDNINICINENFSGRLLKNVDFNDLVSYMYKLDIKDAYNIVDKNYNVIKKYLDINNNIYFLDYKGEYKYNYIEIISRILTLLDNAYNSISKHIEYNKEISRKYYELDNKHKYIIEDNRKIIADKENTIRKKQYEIDKLNMNLQTIYSSRSYIYMQKLKKFFSKRNK